LQGAREDDGDVGRGSHPSDERERFLALPLGRSRRKPVRHNKQRAPDGARFISGCFEVRVKGGDRTRLLDVERLSRSRAASTVDQEDPTCTIARRKRLRTRGADVAGAKDSNG
jgi:hypothetical protein